MTLSRSPAQPVPTPPTSGTVLRRGAEVGVGALGLVASAAGRLLSRVPTAGRATAGAAAPSSPLPGAAAGFVIVAGRTVVIVVGEVLAAGGAVASAVRTPRVVRWSLRPAEELLWRLNDIARREQGRNEKLASAFVPVVIQQATENVIAQLDFNRIVAQVPVDEIVANLDVEAIVARVDLMGVIRESSASLTSEAVDALRAQGMTLDELTARVVDRLCMRKTPRRLDVGGLS